MPKAWLYDNLLKTEFHPKGLCDLQIPGMMGGGVRRKSGFIIEGSGLFGGGSADLLTRVFGTPTDNNVWTFSCLYKRPEFDLGGDEVLFGSFVGGSDQAGFVLTNTSNQVRCFNYTGSFTWDIQCDIQLRDPAAWYNFFVVVDTDNATAADRVQIWLNGVRLTSFVTETNPSSGAVSLINGSGRGHSIGRNYGNTNNPLKGYMSRAVFIDGLALDPTYFGEFTSDGYWQINDVSSLTYGTNGFLIEGGTDVAAGTDSSGNGNDFTPAGTITATNDSPTNDAANGYGNGMVFDVLNPGTGSLNYGAGNTVFAGTSSTSSNCPTTLAASSGKYYAETSINSAAARDNLHWGIASADWPDWITSTNLGSSAASAGVSVQTGPVFTMNAAGGGANSFSITPHIDDRMIAAFDADTGDVWIGVWDDSAGTSNWIDSGGTVRTTDEPGLGTNSTATWDAGGLKKFGCSAALLDGVAGTARIKNHPDDWLGNVPDGFSGMSTQNFPTPDVPDYTTEYHVEKFTHNDTSHVITVGWDTDVDGAFVRVKDIDNLENWPCFSTLLGDNESFPWNDTAAQATIASSCAFSGSTITLGSHWSASDHIIEVWKPGSYFTQMTFEGTGAAHDETFPDTLDTAPGFMATKNLDSVFENIAYHTSLGATKYLQYQTNTAAQTGAAPWNDSEPTTTQVTVGTLDNTNKLDDTIFVAAWANSGPYAFGSYEGNSAADGPVLSVGGQPQTLIRKNIDNANTWVLHSSALSLYNVMGDDLNPSTTAAAATTAAYNIDRTSTSIKLRGTGDDTVNGGWTYIYGAFGITPIQGPAPSSSPNQGRAV